MRSRSTIALTCSALSLLLGGCRLGGGYDRPQSAPAAKTGVTQKRGTLVVATRQPVGSLDPALATTRARRALAYVLCTPLLTYPDDSGVAGTLLVPGLAIDLPDVSRTGRRYTFTLRDDLTFADGTPLRPKDVETAFVRLFSSSMGPEVAANARLFRDVVGVRAFADGKATAIAGITAHSRTISFRLRRADPGFLSRIALPLTCPVKATTPLVPTTSALRDSATGPYRLASGGPPWRLERNPHYAANALGDRGHVATISIRDALREPAILHGLRSGAISLALDGLSPPNARRAADPPRIVVPQPELFAVIMNRASAPLDRFLVRSAITNVLRRQAASDAVGGEAVMTPAREILPPAIRGYSPINGGKIAAAIAAAKINIEPFTADLWVRDLPTDRALGDAVATDLGAIGIKITIRRYGIGESGEKLPPSAPRDAALVLLRVRFPYADPAAALMPLFTGGDTLVPAIPYASVGRRQLRVAILRARRLAGDGREAAFADVARRIVNTDIPVAVLGRANFSTALSSTVSGEVRQPVVGLDLATLSVHP